MEYVWFIWSLALLLIWALFYFSLKDKQSKKEMLVVSSWTSLLGLTEPIFVPEYWSPPSLFDLAMRTGFDIESLIFAFAIGGIVVVVYEKIFSKRHTPMRMKERQHSRHKYHLLALLVAPVLFFGMLLTVDINPIYTTFIALMVGGFATWYCRPDLKKKMIVSAFIFTGIYFVYTLSLTLAVPGYVEQVWNLSAISGITILEVPIEELMFAFGLGFLWSSIYEHVKWNKIT